MPKAVTNQQWRNTRRLILARDEYQCVRCQKEAHHVHHRQVKGMGGTVQQEVWYGPANLISLCMACHRWCHDNPGSAYRLGYLVHSYDLPEKVSVMTSKGLLWLTGEGESVHEEVCALF